MDRLAVLFEEGQSEALAWGRHAALEAKRTFLAMPELAPRIKKPAVERFARIIASLKSPACPLRRQSRRIVLSDAASISRDHREVSV